MAAAIAQAYDSEEDDNDESGFEVDRVDYLQLFSAAITALQEALNEEKGEEDRGETKEEEEEEEKEQHDGAEGEDGGRRRRRKAMQRLEMVVRPLEEVHAHFVRQEDQLQQAASLGQMLLEKNKQLEEQLDVFQNSSILNEYQDKIRIQQERIWELQSLEENTRAECEELKVELQVKKRMLSSKTRLADQLEAKLWDYIQRIEKEKESRESEESKRLKREMEQREKARRLSDELENCKEELKEARSEAERLRKQVDVFNEKMALHRSDLERKRSRSSSFSRRFSSFFINTTPNEAEDHPPGDDEADGDAAGLVSWFAGSGPGSRRQSGRQQPLTDSNGNITTAAAATASNEPVSELVEWKDKARLAREESERLRSEMVSLAAEQLRLRDSVAAMREHDRKVEKERKRERKLLAQAQQTIEELRLRIVENQLVSSSPSSSPASGRHARLSASSPLFHSSSWSVPSTPDQRTASALRLNCPRPHDPFTPPPSECTRYSQHSVQDELAAINEMLLIEEGDEYHGVGAVGDSSDPFRVANQPSSPSLFASSHEVKVASHASNGALTPPVSPGTSDTTVDQEERSKRVWLVAEGQRGRDRSEQQSQENGTKTSPATSPATGENDNDSSDHQPEDGRLFIFAEELEKKVIQKFVVDEEKLREGLQHEVEACVADFLAKREQELQALEPSILRENRGRALGSARDELLLFFGVFLTASAEDHHQQVRLQKILDTTSTSESDAIQNDVGSDRVESRQGTREGERTQEDSEQQQQEKEEEEEEDGWQIIEEWKADREQRRQISHPTISRPQAEDGKARRKKSMAAVQTWVKHIPFGQQAGEEHEITLHSPQTLSRRSSTGPGSPPTPTKMESGQTEQQQQEEEEEEEEEGEKQLKQQQQQEELRNEFARLEQQLLTARRQEASAALRPFLSKIVPGTLVGRPCWQHNSPQRFNFLDLTFYE